MNPPGIRCTVFVTADSFPRQAEAREAGRTLPPPPGRVPTRRAARHQSETVEFIGTVADSGTAVQLYFCPECKFRRSRSLI